MQISKKQRIILAMVATVAVFFRVAFFLLEYNPLKSPRPFCWAQAAIICVPIFFTLNAFIRYIPIAADRLTNKTSSHENSREKNKVKRKF